MKELRQTDTDSLRHEGKKPSETATAMFATASALYAASVPAQAAHIAIECRRYETPLSPEALGNALLADPAQLDIVMNAAKKAHTKRGISTNMITLRDIERIIGIDFELAAIMSALNITELNTILARRNARDEFTTIGEHLFEKDVNKMIQDARKRQATGALGSNAPWYKRAKIFLKTW